MNRENILRMLKRRGIENPENIENLTFNRLLDIIEECISDDKTEP